MASDQYGPGYGPGGPGYGPGQGAPGYGPGGPAAPGYGPPAGSAGPGYGPPAGPGGPGGPGYGPPAGPGGPGYGPPAGPGGPGGPGYGPPSGGPNYPGGPGPGGPGYGPGPSPYGGQPQGPGAYPVKVEFQYPENLSRGLIFVKWLLVIPHLIVLYVLFLCLGLVSFIAWFAILFTGKYPRGMWDFTTGVLRWQLRVASYMYLQHDVYPPFTLQDQ